MVAMIAAVPPTVAQDDRDHVWVVDQNGTETPIYGCWQLVSNTHELSNAAVGDLLVFSAEPLGNDFSPQGTITGADGNLWTAVGISFADGYAFTLLERVDTAADPHRLYVLALLDEDGTYLVDAASTAEHFSAQDEAADLMTYERVGCAAARG
jgi:hypothetical protein